MVAGGVAMGRVTRKGGVNVNVVGAVGCMYFCDRERLVYSKMLLVL